MKNTRLIIGTGAALAIAGTLAVTLPGDETVNIPTEILENVEFNSASSTILTVQNIANENTVRVVLIQDDVIVNVARVPNGWSGKVNEWQPPEGHIVLRSENLAIGDVLVEGQFYRIQDKPAN